MCVLVVDDPPWRAMSADFIALIRNVQDLPPEVIDTIVAVRTIVLPL
jgi:hypothetical protein